MSAQPAFQPDAMPRLAAQGAFRDPRQAILFFGHLLDTPDLAGVPAAANEPYRPAPASAWRRSMAACGRLARRILDGFLTRRERAAGRRHLAELDARLLKDIGLSPTDVWRGSGKLFWQP